MIYLYNIWFLNQNQNPCDYLQLIQTECQKPTFKPNHQQYSNESWAKVWVSMVPSWSGMRTWRIGQSGRNKCGSCQRLPESQPRKRWPSFMSHVAAKQLTRSTRTDLVFNTIKTIWHLTNIFHFFDKKRKLDVPDSWFLIWVLLCFWCITIPIMFKMN